MHQLIGNLATELRQGALLHQVNCQGKMNSGIAKDIRARWPIVFDQYEQLVDEHHNRTRDKGFGLLGRAQIVEPENGIYVVNIFSQQFYGRDGQRYTSYDALDTAFQTVAAVNKIQKLALHHPLIGCGLGGGQWSVVEQIIKHRLGDDTTLWSL